jgi:hypothetical protein
LFHYTKFMLGIVHSVTCIWYRHSISGVVFSPVFSLLVVILTNLLLRLGIFTILWRTYYVFLMLVATVGIKPGDTVVSASFLFPMPWHVTVIFIPILYGLLVQF